MLTGVVPVFALWVLNHIYDVLLELKFVYLDEMTSDLVDEAHFTSESCICERRSSSKVPVLGKWCMSVGTSDTRFRNFGV